jgi:hypothetical protein
MGGIHKCVTTICLLANLFHRSGTIRILPDCFIAKYCLTMYMITFLAMMIVSVFSSYFILWLPGTKEHPRFIHSRQGFEDEEIYRDGISGSDSGRKIQG